MAVASFTQWPQADPDLAKRLDERINGQFGGKVLTGDLYHAEGLTEEGGWWTFDVWVSAEAVETFLQQILQPALDEFNAPQGNGANSRCTRIPPSCPTAPSAAAGIVSGHPCPESAPGRAAAKSPAGLGPRPTPRSCRPRAGRCESP